MVKCQIIQICTIADAQIGLAPNPVVLCCRLKENLKAEPGVWSLAQGLKVSRRHGQVSRKPSKNDNSPRFSTIPSHLIPEIPATLFASLSSFILTTSAVTAKRQLLKVKQLQRRSRQLSIEPAPPTSNSTTLKHLNHHHGEPPRYRRRLRAI